MKPHIYYPFAVLLVAFAVLLFNSGMRFSLGLLLIPMAEDLAWSRTVLSSMATIFMLVTAAALPFTGRFVDRLGAYRVLGIGVLIAAVALLLTSAMTQPWQAYLFYGVLFAVGSAATSITPIGVIVSRAFPTRAGLANSIAISGMGVGQLVIIWVLAAMLLETGWRGAFVWQALASLFFLLPLLFWANRLQQKTLKPAAITTSTLAPSQQRTQDIKTHHQTNTATELASPQRREISKMRDAMKLKPLWLILILYAICGFQDFFVATHIVALATDANIYTETAGQMLAFMGLAGLAGVLLSGVMADYFGPTSVLYLSFVLRGILFTALVVSSDTRVILCAALLFGFTFWMTAPLTVIFAKRLVGVALLGTVSGVITMIHHGMGGLGAVFGALGFDRQGSYATGLQTMLVLSFIGVVVSGFYQHQQRLPATDTAHLP